jgi:hypothetical protein
VRPRLAAGLILLSVLGFVAVRADDATPVDPAVVLDRMARTYASIRTLQVKYRTEIPIPPPDERVFNLGHRDASGREVKLESGTFVSEREYRILRDRLVRSRGSEPGGAGICTVYAPRGAVRQRFDDGLGPLPVASAVAAMVQFHDGRRAIDEPLLRFGVCANLPYQLFFARQFNPAFTEADFRLAPPEPVQPAAPPSRDEPVGRTVPTPNH